MINCLFIESLIEELIEYVSGEMRESPYLIDFMSLILVNSVGFGEGCYEGRSIWAELSGRQ